MYKGMMKILTPHDIENEMTNYIVLGLAFVFESVKWWMVFKEFQSCRRQLGTIAAVRDSKAPPRLQCCLKILRQRWGCLSGF